MKKSFAVIFMCSALLSAAYSQPALDSLKRALHAAQNDKIKAEVLLSLAKAYSQHDLHYAMDCIGGSIKLGMKFNDLGLLSDAYNTKGILYIIQGEYPQAIVTLDTAATMMKMAGNRVGTASVYGNLGSLYFTAGDYERALDYNLRCLRINESLGNELGVAIATDGVGNVFYIQDLFEKALQWYQKSLKLHRKLRNFSGEVTTRINIGMTLVELKKYQLAPYYFNRALQIADSLMLPGSQADAYFGLAMLYRSTSDYRQAQEYYEKALQIYQTVGNGFRIFEIRSELAHIYLHQKDYARSVEFYQDILEEAQEKGTIQYVRDALQGLHEAFGAMKQYDKAYEYQSRFIRLNDSILNADKLKLITEMQTRYETEKKEAENRALINENQIQTYQLNRRLLLNLGLGLLLLIAIGMSFLIIRHHRLRSRQRTMQLEQKLLRTQMNPHFIFNALIAIQSFIFKSEPREAGRYLSGFARLIRNILENSREEYVSLAKEIQTLEHYMELQKLRFDDRFEYTIVAAPELDPKNIYIPPMLAQPFIENSIEHGFRNTAMKGKLDVLFKREGQRVIFEVKDNGVGFEQSISITKRDGGHHSLATKITKERLQILNRKRKKKVSFVIRELKDASDAITGTQVIISIPFRHSA